jgi:hypothetical protein
MQMQSNTNQRSTFALFPLGQTFITPGAEEALMIAGQTGIEFLRRHVSGDFGELSDDDLSENELSLREGFRVLSVYRTANGQKLWIITEADRRSTTILPRRILTLKNTCGASASCTRAPWLLMI